MQASGLERNFVFSLVTGSNCSNTVYCFTRTDSSAVQLVSVGYRLVATDYRHSLTPAARSQDGARVWPARSLQPIFSFVCCIALAYEHAISTRSLL